MFFVQNNLSFLALQHMNSSAFQLLMNTRIVTVAVLSVLVLRKSMNALEWASIVLLMVGAMQYELSGCDAGTLPPHSVAILSVSLSLSLSLAALSLSLFPTTTDPARRFPRRLQRPDLHVRYRDLRAAAAPLVSFFSLSLETQKRPLSRGEAA